MGITERKERERQEMRQLIIETAQKVFIEEGYEKASIRAIAERMEYSPATIYLYFKDKDELFYVVHELGFEKMLAQMEKLETIENPLERLRQRGSVYLKFAFENPELYDLMFISRAPMKALHKDFENSEWDCGHRNFELLLRNVQQCLEQGYLRTMNLHAAAMSIWSLVHGMASLHIRERFKIMEEMNIEAVTEQVLDGMIALMETPQPA
jgi:AcrR family transcriptional regulator